MIVTEVVCVGFLVNSEQQHIGTSVDGLLRAEIRHPLFQSTDASFSEHLTPLEIKTRSSTTTLNHAEALASIYGEFAICEACNHDMFAKMIPHGFERGQILHHTVALGIDGCLYAEASTTGIIRCVLVKVSPGIREAYQRVLYSIKSNHCEWIDNELVPVPEFSPEELGYCVDMHSLQQSLNIWETCNQMFFGELRQQPFPRIKAIIPSLIAYWNHTKGYVDVTSRCLTIGHMPLHHISIEASLWMRVIKLALLQAFSASKCLEVSKSLRQIKTVDALYKKQRSHMSFEFFLGNIAIGAFRNSAAQFYDSAHNSTEQSGAAHDTMTQSGSSVAICPPFKPGTKLLTRIKYFGSPEGVALRTTNVDHIPEDSQVSKMCINCQQKMTKFSCKTCDVYLCIHVHHGRNIPCYKEWHCRECLPKVLESGGTSAASDPIYHLDNIEAQEVDQHHDEQEESDNGYILPPQVTRVHTSVVHAQDPMRSLAMITSDTGKLISTIRSSGASTMAAVTSTPKIEKNVFQYKYHPNYIY